MSQTGPMAPHHRRAVFTVIASTLLVLAIATGTLVAVFYKHLDGNLHAGQAIKHETTKKQSGPKAPLNILVMGLDTRDCAGCKIDNEPGGDGSDTTILVHISADRKSAYGISIPRDALVKPVACTQHSEYKDTGLVQWNAAYSAGGADCTAEQLEKNFGVFVDGYITVNFGGFKGMVDAIHGVNMCIPFELSDPIYEKYTFEPGKSVHLNGTNALKYVRLRHVYGHGLDGSDIARMKRQQAFISAMIDKLHSADTLAQPYKLVQFANSLTKSMTPSPEFDSVKKLVKLAEQVKDIDLTNIQFITVPSQPYDVPRTDPVWGRVEILPAAKKMWKRVRLDKPLSQSLASGAISAGGAGTTSDSTAASGSSTPSGTASASGVPSGSSSASSSTSPSGSSSTETSEQATADAAKYGLCA